MFVPSCSIPVPAEGDIDVIYGLKQMCIQSMNGLGLGATISWNSTRMQVSGCTHLGLAVQRVNRAICAGNLLGVNSHHHAMCDLQDRGAIFDSKGHRQKMSRSRLRYQSGTPGFFNFFLALPEEGGQLRNIIKEGAAI